MAVGAAAAAEEEEEEEEAVWAVERSPRRWATCLAGICHLEKVCVGWCGAGGGRNGNTPTHTPTPQEKTPPPTLLWGTAAARPWTHPPRRGAILST